MEKKIVILIFQLISLFLLQDGFKCAPTVEEFEFVNQIANQIPNQIPSQNLDSESEGFNFKHNSIKNAKYHLDTHHAIANENSNENGQKDIYQLLNEDDDAEIYIIKKKPRKQSTPKPQNQMKGGKLFEKLKVKIRLKFAFS
jgi:hypothetical protein